MAFLPEEGPDVDLDDLYGFWVALAGIEEKLAGLERILDATLAEYKREATVNMEYWPTTRPPTTEYLKSVVHFIGNTNEQQANLERVRKAIIEAEATRTVIRGRLDVAHEKIRVWQTMSANARKVLAVE